MQVYVRFMQGHKPAQKCLSVSLKARKTLKMNIKSLCVCVSSAAVHCQT